MKRSDVSGHYSCRTRRLALLKRGAVLLLFSSIAAWASAGDWPMFRHDAARSGGTEDALPAQPALRWIFKSAHPHEPAWPMPAEELPRVHADNAPHAIAAGGRIFFGSPVDNSVRALDAASGQLLWRYTTQGPVRFAPAFHEGRVFFGSDDGWVYCVTADSGALIWRHRAGPSGEKVLGNGRMVSLWPVRTSVLVDGGQALFGAGVFPNDGIYIKALDPKDGSVLWQNDRIGDLPYELSYGGISPFGYLAASADLLFVPSGRAMPAAFARRDGSFRYYANTGGKNGGSWAMVDGNNLIAGVDASGIPLKMIYDATTGSRRGQALPWNPPLDLVASSQGGCFALGPKGIVAVTRAAWEKWMAQPPSGAAALRPPESGIIWQRPTNGICALIATRNLLVAGGDGFVAGLDPASGLETWRADVDGHAFGLAASDGRLIVSTDKGSIYGFGTPTATPATNAPVITRQPYPEDDLVARYKAAADSIVHTADIRQGYALVRNAGEGRLAYELAMRTELQIVALEQDTNKVALARTYLDNAGLLGSRIVVEPWDPADLPSYFANLIVSDASVQSPADEDLPEAYQRLLRPDGGAAMLRRTDQGTAAWEKVVRGKLEGAGEWTCLYANPANTACSDDQLVKSPLGTLWYGHPGPEDMVDRHSRPVSPLFMHGRLFVQGENIIVAYDAYNGSVLWRREIPGAVRVRADVDGSNLAVTDDSLFVAAGEQCHRLDPATGKTLHTYTVPPAADGSPGRWGWLAAVSGTVFGITAQPMTNEYAAIWTKLVDSVTQTWKKESDWPIEWNAEARKQYKAFVAKHKLPDNEARMELHRDGTLWHSMTRFPSWYSRVSAEEALTSALMAGDTLFAMSVQTGEVLWQYRGDRIANIAVAMADGILYCLDTATDAAARAQVSNDITRLKAEGIYEPVPDDEQSAATMADVRTVLALDAATGRILWQQAHDFTGCGGDKLGLAYKDGVLLCYGNFSNHDTGFFLSGELAWRRITALDARNGSMTWSRPLNYLRRPLIVGDRLIAEPRAVNLFTGKTIMRTHPITDQPSPWEFLRPGHCCSIASASAHTMFYRSSWTAIYDLDGDKGVRLFGGIRPGCWLNMISAGGIMVMPDSSSGCTCSYPIRCSLAMIHKPHRRAQDWTVFITHGPMMPVRRLGINFGAPADWRDDNGDLWLGYPRPNAISDIGYGRYGLNLNLHTEISAGQGYATRPAESLPDNEARQMALFRDDCRGLLNCEVPLIDDMAGQMPAHYTVRLGFCAPIGDMPGSRVFDVYLQDQLVVTQLDVLATAGGPNKPLFKEIKNVPVQNSLRVRMAPHDPAHLEHPERSTLISYIEVLREDPLPAASANAPSPISAPQAAALLKAAHNAQTNGQTETALARYHEFLDSKPDATNRAAVFMALAEIGSSESLRYVLEEWNRAAYPILDEYRNQAPDALQSSMNLFLAIIANPALTRSDRIKPLNARVTKFLTQLPTSLFRMQLIELCGSDRRAIPFLNAMADIATDHEEALATRRALLSRCLRYDPALALETLEAMLKLEQNPAFIQKLQSAHMMLLGRLGHRDALADLRKQLLAEHSPAIYRSIALDTIEQLIASSEPQLALEAIEDLQQGKDNDAFIKTFLLNQKASCLRALDRAAEASTIETRLASAPAASWIKFIANKGWTGQPCPLGVSRTGVIAAAKTPPRIDGKLDDECWQSAALYSGFIGNDNTAPVEPQTLIAVRYDRDNLYAAILAVETDGSSIQINKEAIWEGDSIECFIWDEAGTNEYGQLLVSPAGDVSQARTWQGTVTAAASSNQLGWIVEIQIPAASIGRTEFKPGTQLRINICRNKSQPLFQYQTWSDVGHAFHNKTRFGVWQFE